MCVIILSKQGSDLTIADFHEADRRNSDGIGIMSSEGTRKFMGKKRVRRAWAYYRKLHGLGLDVGIHFRMATHGDINTRSCHPFDVPGTGAVMMHNGILYTSQWADKDNSDSRILAERILPGFGSKYDALWTESLERLIGNGNKLLVLDSEGTFHIVNEKAGCWVTDRLWFSNTLSLSNKRWTAPSKGLDALVKKKATPAVTGPSWDVGKGRRASQWGFDWHDTDTWRETLRNEKEAREKYDDDVPVADRGRIALPPPPVEAGSEDPYVEFAGLDEDGNPGIWTYEDGEWSFFYDDAVLTGTDK